MRKLLLLILLGLSLSISSQTKMTNIFNEKFGAVTLSQAKIENNEKELVIKTVLFFQDSRFTAISNLKFITFYSKKDVELFIENLKKALVFAKSGEKSITSFGGRNIKYGIDANGINGSIALWSYEDADGIVLVHPNKITKIIEALEVIKENYGN